MEAPRHAVIAAWVLFVGWATFLGELYEAPATGHAARVVGLAYPIVGVVMVSMVLVVEASWSR